MKISVIIPFAPAEEISSTLIGDLNNMPDSSEVLFVSSDLGKLNRLSIELQGKSVRFIHAPSGRALCMNAGAEEARNGHLLFLHADSHFGNNALSALFRSLAQYPEALHFFDLVFHKGSSPLMKLNQWGAYFRSRCLHTPFGDQGFCIAKGIFRQFGGYPTDASCGEDHLFVRKLRRNNIPLMPVRAPLYTSARKYILNGWLKTTVMHLYLWLSQAYRDHRDNRRSASYE